PINAPKCPYHTLQQDGHMAMENPKGRANYEPNSWGGAEGGPRENPQRGFHSYPAEEAGTKQRLRPESFSDHYSQARQFFISQTEVEQDHITDALVFELSKVDTVAIRARMVS
ncbi:MAG TPA: catalase HPII, partial [Alcanivorax sp.]|nr:catalase HPII [Alcanivorax sp.]